MSQKLVDWIESHAAIILIVAAFLVTVVHLLTIGEYPSAWFDEIEILEMGRFSVFDVHPEWSVNLMANSDGSLATPSPYFHYLSGALLEALYRTTGGFVCGRIVMLLSLPMCALALFAWLRTSGLPVIVAFVTALLFLCDPNATICAHWYRPDLWCMTLLFASLSLIETGSSRRNPTIAFVLPGVMLAVSVFFWITSALFLPLVALVLWRMKDNRLAHMAWVAAGGAAATAVLLIPMYPYFIDVVNQYLSSRVMANVVDSGSCFVLKIVDNALTFFKIAMRTPFVWTTAAIGVVLTRKNRVYGVFFIGLILFMIMTRIYHLRMVYLMPCLFFFVAEAINKGLADRRAVLRRLTLGWVMISMSIMFLISVVLLNYAAWPESNTLREFTAKLQDAVPDGNPRVYLWDMEHELYYAGRKLGWKMYSAAPRNAILKDSNADLLKTMDAVVVTAMGPKPSEADIKALSDAGFAFKANVEMPPAATGWLKSKLATFVYAHGYPSATAWIRK